MRIPSALFMVAFACAGCGGGVGEDAGVSAPMDAGVGSDGGSARTDGGPGPDDGGSMGIDAGPGDDGGAADAGPGPTDGGACAPITEDASKIGMTCSPDGPACGPGYSCEALNGIVVTYFCQIRCAEDCECPTGTTCQPFSDKAGTRHFCSAI